MTEKIEHVFVLMLENRSFDHMLGFSPIRGQTIQGVPAQIDGLIGKDMFNLEPGTGVRELASTPAEYKIPSENCDPPHEFEDVLTQLCGPGSRYDPNIPYPAINSSGFIAAYGEAGSASPRSIMRCFEALQLPLLNALAAEFAVCDRWFSSMPGPTWPNRFFVHAASSAGLDDSPSSFETATDTAVSGYAFEHGTIFDALDDKGLDWEIVGCDKTLFLQSFSLRGMTRNWFRGRFIHFDGFVRKLANQNYNPAYVFIEPNWGHMLPGTGSDFTCGNSQHPLDDVTRGEALIKTVYEAIRNSPLWEKSVLILTYDEHGGFYDHVAPPGTVAPGDRILDRSNNHNDFDFRQLGVRVPAVVISPWILRGTIDSRVFDHSAVPALIERVNDIEPLTWRDEAASDLRDLLALPSPRTDAPMVLPDPAASGYHCKEDPEEEHTYRRRLQAGEADSDKPVSPTTRGFLHIAMLRHLVDAGDPETMTEIHEAVRTLRGLEIPRMILERYNPRQAEIIHDFLEIKSESAARDYINNVRREIRSRLR